MKQNTFKAKIREKDSRKVVGKVSIKTSDSKRLKLMSDALDKIFAEDGQELSDSEMKIDDD